jgi:hypothetical protein
LQKLQDLQWRDEMMLAGRLPCMMRLQNNKRGLALLKFSNASPYFQA